MLAENPYYSRDVHGPYEIFELGDFALESAITLPGAKLAYRTFGALSPAKDNAILFPHMYSGTHQHMERFVGKGMALDPDKYFIILPGQFGNGCRARRATRLPLQPGRVPERDNRGRRARPAAPGHRGVPVDPTLPTGSFPPCLRNAQVSARMKTKRPTRSSRP
jgi:hypothetical protein